MLPVITVEYYPFVKWLHRLTHGVKEVRLPPQQFDYAYHRIPQHFRWTRMNDGEPNFILFGCSFRRAL
jgi:hypothetical protein